MSLADSSVSPESSAIDGKNIDESESNYGHSNSNDACEASSSSSLSSSQARTSEAISMDRQPQAPRRSITPTRALKDLIDVTNKIANTTLNNANNTANDDKAYDSDGESTIEDDFDFINKVYGGNDGSGSGNSSGGSSDSEEGSDDDKFPAFAMLPPPPELTATTSSSSLRNPNNSNKNNGSVYRFFGEKRHEYDGTRQPHRSSLRDPNGSNRNIHSIDNSKNNNIVDVTRGIGRNKSADGTEDTRRGSGSLHSVRMRGSIYPVHRRTSIGFEDTVRVQEVTPTVELNDGNMRELWLQADEAMEIKERRRSLLKKYKEKEAKKRKEAERLQREREKVLRQQKVKNLLNPSKNNFLHSLAQSSKPATMASPPSSSTTKKHPRWSGILKKADLPLPGPSARRWKASFQNDHSPQTALGISLPNRGEDRASFSSISMGTATSSFLSLSSVGSSFSHDDNSDSFRGLEKYIDRSGRQQKNMVWDAVFIEQDEQLQFGYYDDERIANLYRSVQNQHDGQQKSLERARKDRKAADNYLMTPRTLKLMKKTIDVSSITCGSLVPNAGDEETKAATNGSNKSKSNSGNGVETSDAKDDNNNDDESRTSTTATLKSSGDSRSRLYIRRLSV